MSTAAKMAAARVWSGLVRGLQRAALVRRGIGVAPRGRTQRFVLAAWLGVFVPACVTRTREVSLTPLTAVSLERGAGGVSPVTATFGIDDGVASGQVEWATTCRRTLTEQARTQTVTETRGSPAAGIATAIGAGVLGTAAMASFVGTVPGEAVCEAVSGVPSDDATDSSDCHHSAAVPAVLGVSALALLVTSLVLFKSPPSTVPGPVSLEPPAPPRVIAENVACNTGPIGGLAVALYRTDQRIGTATTDATGHFAVQLPAGTAGSLVLVIDAVPAQSTILHQGDVLARAEAVAP